MNEIATHLGAQRDPSIAGESGLDARRHAHDDHVLRACGKHAAKQAVREREQNGTQNRVKRVCTHAHAHHGIHAITHILALREKRRLERGVAREMLRAVHRFGGV